MVNSSSVFPLPQAIEDAFVFMEANCPSHSKEFFETLGAYQGEHWSNQHQPHFKGWVGMVDEKTRYSADMGNYPEDLSKISYVGMWVGRTKSQVIIWCAMPSMNHGSAVQGQIIEMGDARVLPGQYTQDELDAMVIRGRAIMQGMIDEYGKFNA